VGHFNSRDLYDQQFGDLAVPQGSCRPTRRSIITLRGLYARLRPCPVATLGLKWSSGVVVYTDRLDIRVIRLLIRG